MNGSEVWNALRRIQDTFRIDGKIEAIKEYREIFGDGLKESKDMVEALMAVDRLPTSDRLKAHVSLGVRTGNGFFQTIPLLEWLNQHAGVVVEPDIPDRPQCYRIRQGSTVLASRIPSHYVALTMAKAMGYVEG